MTKLAPVSLQSQLVMDSKSDSMHVEPDQLRRDLGSHKKKVWESWWILNDVFGRITLFSVVGGLAFVLLKLFPMQYARVRNLSTAYTSNPGMHTSSKALMADSSPSYQSCSPIIDKSNIVRSLRKVMEGHGKTLKHPVDQGMLQNQCTDDVSFSNLLQKRLMLFTEAESLVRQWQETKAEALGPSHQIQCLSDVLGDTMLTQVNFFNYLLIVDGLCHASKFWLFVCSGRI